MKYFLKKSFFATIAFIHLNSYAMRSDPNPSNTDYVTPVVAGMAAGYVYERSLYKLPLVLAVPTVLGAIAMHAISSATFFDGNQAVATGIAASLTAIALYMREQTSQKPEIIIVEEQYEAPKHHHRHHHRHGRYHHSAEIEVEVG